MAQIPKGRLVKGQYINKYFLGPCHVLFQLLYQVKNFCFGVFFLWMSIFCKCSWVTGDSPFEISCLW